MSQTQDWIYVENSKEIFRKTEFYSLKWTIDNMNLSVASFAGPIVITRDVNKPDLKPFLSVYSQSGYLIKSFQLEDKSTILGVGWTSNEDICIVKESGEVQIRNMFGLIKSMFNFLKDSKAVDYRIFNTLNTYTGLFTTGIVIQTAKNKFILAKDVYDAKLQQFPEIPGLIDPDSWCVISTDKKCFILVSKGNDIYQLMYGGSPQLLKLNYNIAFNSICKIIPSFNNETIALSTDNGYLVMCNSDLTRIIFKYQSDNKEPVKDLAWISNKAVLAYWDSLFLIPLEGDDMKNHFEIYYTPPVHLVQELDGVRIITSDKNEFLQIVPEPLRDVFEIAAFDASSTLYESSIAFYENKNQKAEEYIRSIKDKGSLKEAITNCINAAPHEFETKYQVELLRAALFGRYFDDYADASPYVKMCQTIRVINAIRQPQIGLPFTYVQYDSMTAPVVINRLIARRHFALAIEISKYLNMTDEEGIVKILSNWALYKVAQTDVEDDRIAVMIKSKLGDTPGISYAEIARCAIKAGRPGLAIKLLEYETKASEQVPLYTEIDNSELAFRKAMESGDSDLIYVVLFWYQKKFNNLSDFMKDISKRYPPAFNLMLQYFRQKSMHDQNSNELGDILNQENLVHEQVSSILRVAKKQERVEQRLQMYDEAKRLFGNDDKFNASLLSDEIKLIKIQMSFEKNYRLQLNGKSLFETLAELFRANLLDEAEKLRKEFKISDTTESWWHLKAKNLAKGNLWDELEKFSKSKKSLIGYEPFVYYCMDMNNIQEAKKYFPKVLAENRFKCLIKMRCLTDALDMAYQNKDTLGINLVITKCDQATQKILIDKAKALRAELLQK